MAASAAPGGAFGVAPWRGKEATPIDTATKPSVSPACETATVRNPSVTGTLDPTPVTPLLLQATVDTDEAQAATLVKFGADPNGRDRYGTPVLSRAVTMCRPRVVKALVDAGVGLTYERAPGLTVPKEADPARRRRRSCAPPEPAERA